MQPCCGDRCPSVPKLRVGLAGSQVSQPCSLRLCGTPGHGMGLRLNDHEVAWFLVTTPSTPAPSGLRVLMTPVESLSFKAGSSSWLQGTCRPVTCPLSQKSRPLQSEYLGFFSSSAAALHGESFHLFEPHFAHLSNGTILIATGLLGRTDR